MGCGPAFLVAEIANAVGPRLLEQVGCSTGGVGPPSFGINYATISFGQLSGYIVFCTVPIWEAKPPL